jgi:hypothetical protein
MKPTKLTELTPKQKKLLDKFIDKAEMVMFDKEDIVKRIRRANELRNKAHEMMLEADILLDGIIKEMYGDDKTEKN